MRPSQGQYEGVCDIQMREPVLFDAISISARWQALLFPVCLRNRAVDPRNAVSLALQRMLANTMTLDLDERGEVALLLFAGRPYSGRRPHVNRLRLNCLSPPHSRLPFVESVCNLAWGWRISKLGEMPTSFPPNSTSPSALHLFFWCSAL